MITRRELLVGASAIAIVVAIAGIETLQPAAAQSVTAAELLVPPPLGDRTLGKDDAPVTIVEYASMTCPHCAHFHETTYPELKKRYIDTGKVRFIFREFPLDPLAAGASMLARCADKDKFYPLIETLFQQQTQMGGREADPAAHGDRQAGRHQRADLQRLPVGSEDARRHPGRAEARHRQVRGQFHADACSSTARSRSAAMSIDDLAKVIDPLLPKS